MIYKNRILLILAVTALILNACGGGENKFYKPADKNSTTSTEVKVKSCTSGFSSVKKDDMITSLTNDTKLTIRHKDDGKKEACVISGEAKIN